jgi:hypothetical protein
MTTQARRVSAPAASPRCRSFDISRFRDPCSGRRSSTSSGKRPRRAAGLTAA